MKAFAPLPPLYMSPAPNNIYTSAMLSKTYLYMNKAHPSCVRDLHYLPRHNTNKSNDSAAMRASPSRRRRFIYIYIYMCRPQFTHRMYACLVYIRIKRRDYCSVLCRRKGKHETHLNVTQFNWIKRTTDRNNIYIHSQTYSRHISCIRAPK